MSDDQLFSYDDRTGSIAQGFFMGLGLSVLQAILTGVAIGNFSGNGDQGLFIGIGGFPLFQLCWAVPVILYLRKRGRTQSAKGMIIETAFVVLISATCWLAAI